LNIKGIPHSGQEPTVIQALLKLESLFQLSKTLTDHEVWGLTILPGSGINAKTVPGILARLLPLGLREIHLSGGHWVPNGMDFKRPNMGMGLGGESDWGIWRTQTDKVKEVRRIVDATLEEFVRQKATM
jgi:copper homeostasis protein